MQKSKIRQQKTRRNTIIRLIKADVSIPRISRQLDVHKSTIYYHYKKIKGRKFPLVKIKNDDLALGEFLGAFAGDGSFFFDKKTYHYTFSLFLHAQDDRAYGYYLRRLIYYLFHKKVRIYFRQDTLMSLMFYSKAVYELVKGYLNIEGNKTLNISLKKPISQLSSDFLKRYVRGLVDTDGHVNKYGQIVLVLISKKAIMQVSSILFQFGIENKIFLRKLKPREHQQYELKILRMHARRYLTIIGFSNKRKAKRIS